MARLRRQRIALFDGKRVENLTGDSLETAVFNGNRSDFSTEVFRLMRDRTCAHCSGQMRELRNSYAFDGTVLVCRTCGYWGGRGTRLEMGPVGRRGVLGRVRYIDLNSNDVQFEELLGHLQRVPSALLDLAPFRAERVVMQLLAEVLNCEVKPVGGVKDHGVDGYIVAGDEVKTIVQVKWHHSMKRAESVQVIREIGGTLLARGVPQALLVTTRQALSRAAQAEASAISSRTVEGVGRLRIDVRTYNDLLDMLDLAWARVGDDFESVNYYLCEDDAKVVIFDYFRRFGFLEPGQRLADLPLPTPLSASESTSHD